MNSKQAMIALAAAVTLLCGCGENSEQSRRLNYLAVQMEKNADWSIIDKDGNEVVKEEYPADAIISSVSEDGSFWVRSGDKYQLFNVSEPKQPLIDEEFTQVTAFEETGLSAVGSPNSPIRIIDTKGHIVATLATDIKRCYGFYNGYAPIQNVDDLYGIIDKKGNVVVKPAYADMRCFGNGTVLVMKQTEDKTWIIIDMKGEKHGEINTEKYQPQWFTNDMITAVPVDDPSAPLVVLDKTGKKLFNIRKAPAEKNRFQSFRDGYMVFVDEEGKYGVVDSQGETMIRSRYEDMVNLGRGEFAAKKGDKWGVVNVKDETLVDFDFSGHSWEVLGEHFLLRDGNTWLLMSKENKEVASFDNISTFPVDSYVDYVNIDNLAEQTAKKLEELEISETAQQWAEKMNLDIEQNHYTTNIDYDLDIDYKVTVASRVCFENTIAQEKTHIEKVNDGWFTTDKVVSDGWAWSTETSMFIIGKIVLANELDFDTFFTALDTRLKQSHQTQGDGQYTRTVSTGDSQTKFLLELKRNDGKLDYSIRPVEDQ